MEALGYSSPFPVVDETWMPGAPPRLGLPKLKRGARGTPALVLGRVRGPTARCAAASLERLALPRLGGALNWCCLI